MQFSAILTSIIFTTAALWMSSPPVYAQGRDNSHFDDVIFDMAQAYKAHDKKKLTTLLPQVSGYLLEPWAAYWELSARLDEAGPTEIQTFLTRYADTYQEDRLRVEWLQMLGRNRDWATFAREIGRYRMDDDRSVRCYSLMADHIRNGTDVHEAVASNWLAAKDADDACTSAVQQLLDDRSLKEDVVWQRARLGMDSDRLRVTVQAVALIDDRLTKKVNNLYNDPARFIKDAFPALRPQTRELVALALIRLAYTDPDQAAQELKKVRWHAQLAPDVRSWIWGAIGKRAAQKLSDEAVGYFTQGQLVAMHEDQLTWAARAALRVGNWSLVQAAIAAMPATLRAEPTWIYWNAKAQLASGATPAARENALQALRDLASIRGFYEQLALEETGQWINLPPRPAPLTADERDAARNTPGLARALYAIQIGLRNEGVREWNYTTNLHQRGGMEDRALLAAADLACRAEVWDRCISSSDRTKSMIDMEQRFPTPYRSAVQAQAKKLGVDPAYVYGLIRQESRFVMNATSNVGASGLMQVMPATARWTAKKIGLTEFQPQQLNDRDTNIVIGTGYLKLLLDSFDGSIPLATAAYNAGPSRSRSWRASTPGAAPLEAAIWAENIPFTETRDYVKKVIANTTLYAALMTGQPQSIKARLGSVAPRDAARPDGSTELP